uniref:Uncharacterized protein n=1 Tax=Chenopodium quinoa TaxID=63459 RepID=A0A803NBW2_CHEQI
MSTKEQWPYVCESQKVENAYLNVIHQEEIQLSQEGDDEADSAKCNKNGGYVNYDDYCSEDEEEPFNVWNCKSLLSPRQVLLAIVYSTRKSCTGFAVFAVYMFSLAFDL